MSLSGAQKRKLAALKKENKAEKQSSLSRCIKKQKPSPCGPVQQTEQAGKETPQRTATPVAGLSEPQFRRHAPQDEEHCQSSNPTDISLSSLDPSSQPKLVQYPAQVTANGKPKRSLNASYYGKHPWLEYSVPSRMIMFTASAADTLAAHLLFWAEVRV
ncbi:hypothetical protein QYM36_004514 [Artemia franciscana]|uniref:Uncharacterized protein n=1 Tax=Artemia franciscana TaxID=6661 RepID=A0AA88I2W7_ARTSF|nr:hypothetical protein QYM36_004514 [Artemia franciscana]